MAAGKRRGAGTGKKRRIRVTAEVIVEVTDVAVLEKAVLAEVDETAFSVEPGQSMAEVRAEVRRDVQGDPAGAVAWVADAGAIIPDVPGLRVVGSTQTTVEVDRAGLDVTPEPDFTGLFPVCRCGQEDCDPCTGFQLTPRTAAALWTVGQILADYAYDDVLEHGDDPVVDRGEWVLFGNYPRITWRQDAVWRRQAARSFDDLTAELGAGRWPQVTCPGEEMALHLMLRAAPEAVADRWASLADSLSRLQRHPDDYDWDLAGEVLVQDEDVLTLFDPRMDGIEDPDNESNQRMRMGDYRPASWFQPFDNRTRRDGRRGFRR